ncbi:hypothetical protein [Microbacterium sp. W4I4]|nr:hypothetical protein [Microbacterium sp. W4I4]
MEKALQTPRMLVTVVMGMGMGVVVRVVVAVPVLRGHSPARS